MAAVSSVPFGLSPQKSSNHRIEQSGLRLSVSPGVVLLSRARYSEDYSAVSVIRNLRSKSHLAMQLASRRRSIGDGLVCPSYIPMLESHVLVISLHEPAYMPRRILAALAVFAKCNPWPDSACIMEDIR